PEKILSAENTANRVELTTPQHVGYNTAFYTVVLFVDGDDLHIIEAFYPNEETFKKRRASVEKAIGEIQPHSWWVAFIPFI
ncbi:MAG: hypothetical protein KDK33_03120, partial [Leptospiraceae bacterium]|nr:hypothetical protein [Leptospiraceae bacterium]